MQRAIIFSNGEYRSTAGVISRLFPGDFLICADGALAWMQELGLQPDLLVGDMDSVSSILVEQAVALGVEVLRVPAEKDFTDTEMALREAIKRGYNDVIVFGAWGDRIDHSLGNLLLFPPFVESGTRVALSDGKSDAYYVKDVLELHGCRGKTVSLLPLTPSVQRVSIDGFHYPLREATLCWGQTLGVSNLATSDKVSVSLARGMLLVVTTDLTLATDDW